MGTFTAYKESLFSENLKEVRYKNTGLAGQTLKITVSITWYVNVTQYTDQVEYSLVMPDGGTLVFNVADILRPFKASDKDMIKNLRTGGQGPLVTIGVGSESWSKQLLIGGVDESVSGNADSQTIVDRQFLTVRPQTDDTVPGLPQRLSAALADDMNGYTFSSKTLMVKIYFRGTDPLTLMHSNHSKRRGSGGRLSIYNYFTADVGYESVKQLAEDAGVTDEIVAYDLWGTLEGTKDGVKKTFSNVPYPQRFVVRRPRKGWSYYMFLNSLYGIDTLIARGQLRTIPEGDTYTFINSDRESEQHNDTKVYYEVNTGYIRSVEYRNLWYEFFRSTLRCVTDLEGNIRNIIVDEYEAEYNEYREITSFTFKFHMADREMPAVPVRLQMDGTPSEDEDDMRMTVQPSLLYVDAQTGSGQVEVQSRSAWQAAVSDTRFNVPASGGSDRII